MLIRLIGVISLINFILLMISGSALNMAIYKSLLIFLILFSVVYLTIFFLNVIRQENKSETPVRVEQQGESEEQNNEPRSS